MDFNLLTNENLEKKLLESIAISEWNEAKMIKNGYSLGYLILPVTLPIKKKVFGLKSLHSILERNKIIWNCEKKEILFLGVLINNEIAYWDIDIKSINLNERNIKKLTLKDLMDMDGGVKIELEFWNEEKAEEANSELIYLISPYRPDDYYLNKGVEELIKGSGGSN